MTKEVKISDKVSIFSDGTVSGTNVFEENGYLYIIFEGKRTAIHRLVAQHFLNQGNSIEEFDVHHIDFNPKNNNVNNLLILTRRRHAALHCYLDTPEGYRQLQEDIKSWKDKANYYRRKAAKLEKLNELFENNINRQIKLIAAYKESIETLNTILSQQTNTNIINAEHTKEEIENVTMTDEDKYKWCDKCIKEYGKVTAKRLSNLGCKNSQQVSWWWRRHNCDVYVDRSNYDEIIKECIDKYGKVTRKNLQKLDVSNYDSVYHLWYKDNK